ncbi:MAG TPA: hypothetical protein VIX80_07630 [Candidatus Kapabacteria bacterium]
MKNLLLLTVASVLIIGCAEKTPDTTNAAEMIATDKMKIVEVLMLADAKGTAGEAFIEAAKDPSLAAKMKIAVAEVTQQGATRSSGTNTKSATPPAKDDLEKAAETLEKTGKVVDQAGELKRKTEDAMKK